MIAKGQLNTGLPRVVALLLSSIPVAIHADVTVSSSATQNGGTFTVSPTGQLFVNGATNPLLHLTSGATTAGITNLRVGNNQQGRLTVDAGSVLSNSGTGFIGFSAGSNGTVTVVGAGSQWNSGGGVAIGGSSTAGGTGLLTVSNAGSIDVGGTLKIWNSGTFTLDGGTASMRTTARTTDDGRTTADRTTARTTADTHAFDLVA